RTTPLKKTAAAILMMLGLALAGFGSAGYAARSGATAARDLTTATSSLCTRAHPCPNPGCTESLHGSDDCLNTTPQETSPPTTSGRSTTTAATTTAVL